MKEDTKRLLEECTAGCTMAVESMDQVKGFTENAELLRCITKAIEEHKRLEEEAAKLLEESGEAEKEPGTMATAFSWITTEMKLLMRDDSHQIAKVIMDGCNMGIQSICKYQNQYIEASDEAKNLAKRLVKTEENLMQELEAFL